VWLMGKKTASTAVAPGGPGECHLEDREHTTVNANKKPIAVVINRKYPHIGSCDLGVSGVSA
jgi:hypothetical protein